MEFTWDRRTVDAIHKRPRCCERYERVHVGSMARGRVTGVGYEERTRAKEDGLNSERVRHLPRAISARVHVPTRTPSVTAQRRAVTSFFPPPSFYHVPPHSPCLQSASKNHHRHHGSRSAPRSNPSPRPNIQEHSREVVCHPGDLGVPARRGGSHEAQAQHCAGGEREHLRGREAAR